MLFEHGFGIKFVSINKKDIPPVVQDLKRFINPSTIENYKFIVYRINKFNESMDKKFK